MELLSIRETPARKITNYKGSYSDFLALVEKYNLEIEPALPSGTIYAVNNDSDLAYRPQKGNIIKFTEWKEDL